MSIQVAAKAANVGYAAVLLGAQKNIKIEIIDDKVVSKETPADVVYEGVSGTKAVVEKLAGTISAEDQEWIDFAFANLLSKDFKVVTPSLEKLEAHLNFRSFINGYTPSLSDLVVWGVLRSNMVVGTSLKSGVFINLGRWYNYLLAFEYGPVVETFTKDLNEIRKSAKSGQKKVASKASFEIGLVNAKEGEVVTRFPPEPSGYLHIGHAKAAVLNEYFARQYKGKLIIRFDDTNPSKEKEEFQDSILEDLDLLGIKGDVVSYSSDYFQEMYDLCIKMIKEGKAYADDTTQEVMREQRMDGIASARRDRPVEESLDVFENQMAKGTEEGLKNCIRAKISVDAGNKTLRDPVIYRCNLTPHHRTGDKWKVYPTYDFCCPIVDSIEGVTHALRTIEYRDRNAQYDWMLKALGLRKVHIWDFARVNFVRTLLSKRKLQWFVDQDKVESWSDPRFPTVRGVRRRGMTVEGLRNFIISQGPSKNIINLDWSLIWAINKKVIDPVAPRHSAVVKKDVVEISFADAAPETIEDRPKHKKNPDLGTKKTVFGGKKVLIDQDDAQTLKDGEELTLMDWGNIIVEKIHKNGDLVTGIDAKLHLEGDFKKTEHKVSWLAESDATPCELVDFDHLITKDKIEEGENFEDWLTPETIFKTEALADSNIKNMKVGDIIQFERKGYYRLDQPWSEGKPAVFFTIPDGKVVQKYGAKK
ncbi:Glutamate--tRNA ligase, cytoplasmic [Yarrowia sp. B02]|nr:Glutamate--tRNA ligase, cytoplasmic [Yarrowia sp. B02]